VESDDAFLNVDSKRIVNIHWRSVRQQA